MKDEMKERLTRRPVWVRALFMVLFAVAFYVIVQLLVGALAIVQFLIVLISGRANKQLLRFGSDLSAYVYQILRFLTFNTEAQPFPFSDWPNESVGDNLWTDESHAPKPPVSEEG